MGISGVGTQNASNNYMNQKVSQNSNSLYGTTSNAVTKTEENGDGKILGIGFLDNTETNTMYGMTASYATNSTDENPVIQVSVAKEDGEKEYYNIIINDINPSSASELEMFALCNYADDKGMGTGGTFGSWQTLKYYKINADNNGYSTSSSTAEEFQNLKQNWTNLVSSMMRDYMNGGIYDQALDGNKLLAMFEGYPKAGEKVSDGKYPDKTMTDEEWKQFIGRVDKIIDNVKENVKEEIEEKEKKTQEEQNIEKLEKTNKEYSKDANRLITEKQWKELSKVI